MWWIRNSSLTLSDSSALLWKRLLSDTRLSSLASFCPVSLWFILLLLLLFWIVLTVASSFPSSFASDFSVIHVDLVISFYSPSLSLMIMDLLLLCVYPISESQPSFKNRFWSKDSWFGFAFEFHLLYFQNKAGKVYLHTYYKHIIQWDNLNSITDISVMVITDASPSVGFYLTFCLQNKPHFFMICLK